MFSGSSKRALPILLLSPHNSRCSFVTSPLCEMTAARLLLLAAVSLAALVHAAMAATGNVVFQTGASPLASFNRTLDAAITTQYIDAWNNMNGRKRIRELWMEEGRGAAGCQSSHEAS